MREIKRLSVRMLSAFLACVCLPISTPFASAEQLAAASADEMIAATDVQTLASASPTDSPFDSSNTNILPSPDDDKEATDVPQISNAPESIAPADTAVASCTIEPTAETNTDSGLESTISPENTPESTPESTPAPEARELNAAIESEGDIMAEMEAPSTLTPEASEAPVPLGASGSGSFCIVANTNTQLVIPPMVVDYGVGDTILSALEKLNGHSIFDLSTGEITRIDGVEGYYTRYDEKGEYDLNRPASEIRVMSFAESTAELSSERVRLILVMATYLDDADARANETAVAIYAEALAAYLTLSDGDAAAYAEKLNAAMAGEEIPAGDENAPELVDGWYQITSGGEMKWFAELVNGTLEGVEANASANARLMCNVNLSDTEWTPVGSANRPYQGTFDGCAYSISGLRISAEGSHQALFGYVGSKGSVQNLTVSGSVDVGGSYVAGIVGYCEGNLSNLHNRCKVVSSGQYVGGVVGAFSNRSCTAKNCSNSGSIYSSNASGSAYVGGIIGGKSGSVVGCENSGAITAYSYVGGIAGQAHSAIDCKNTGNIQCSKQYGGGVIGYATASVSDCSNAGRISISGVYSPSSSRHEANYIGGVVGGVNGNSVSVSDCTNRGDVIGRASGASAISYVGGVIGRSFKLSRCKNYGAIDVSGSYIAGVAGGKDVESVIQCANFGKVTNRATSGEMTGGVASSGQLEECYNLAAVHGYASVGGVVGGASNSSVRYCYNLAPVSGQTKVGGLAGVCEIASYCYNAGEVSISGAYGSQIAAECSNAANCYYLDTLSLFSKIGTALDRSALRLCMRDCAHFDLNLNEGHHDGYPCLAWEKADTSAKLESISLPENEKDRYTMVSGGAIPKLPEKMRAHAGGMDFLCDANWLAPADFDGITAGEYAFTPEISLPSGCTANENAAVQQVVIAVLSQDALPKLSSIRLEDGVQTEFFTDFGVEPTGFPSHALAVIDGVEQRIAISWQAPENLDLTDTASEFIYTLRLEEACAIVEGAVLPTLSLRVRPMMLVDDMLFTEKSSIESAAYALDYLGMETIDGVECFRYRMPIYDRSRSAYLHIDSNPLYADATELSYSFTALIASPIERSGKLSDHGANALSGFVAGSAAYVHSNRLTITAQAEIDGAPVQQIYTIETCVLPTLRSLQVLNGDTSNLIMPEFDNIWFDYSAQVPSGTESVALKMATTMSTESFSGLSVAVNGAPAALNSNGIFEFTLPITGDDVDSVLCISYIEDGGEASVSEYHLRISRLQETLLKVSVEPADALLTIANGYSGSVYANADGSYSLIRSYEYSYTASAYGYESQSGVFIAENPEMLMEIRLKAADPNEAIQEDMDSEWSGFRGDDSNNAVTGSSTPISASEAVLYWANQAGIDFGSDAVSSPILVDGYLICTAKQNIFKIDTLTGEIVQVGDMIKKSAFNITPPTYAKGMIFVALADGTVQAFNAKTLESLWIYVDPLGGQPNSPISYRNGYIYTGFWNGEKDDGNWVCISITDENPHKTDEEKKAAWTYTQKGGFYWAGAYAADGFIVMGTDDGEQGYTSSTGNLLSLDPKTGRLIDCLTGLKADVRCTICYDRATERYYFTSKGGYFYSVAISKDGYFDRDSLKSLDLRGGKAIEGMSTSTPVVYNGRAYVGVSGTGQFSAYSGHNITVIDLASWTIAYTCPTKGYPQTSGLLTTAYENTGLVYIYFFDNYTPGCLRVIRDCPGQKQLLSIYDASPIDEAEILFTPRGAQQQYAICSPIVDAYGTFYFKNDSGYMMAMGSKILRLEVVEQPSKRIYEEGESFDPSGMRVIEHLANGCTRDITQNVRFSADPLTAADTDVTIYFDYILYNDDTEIIDRPQTVVNVKVFSSDDMAALRNVVNQINALGEITIESGEALSVARRDYDALSDAIKEQVSNYDLLTRAEEEYDLLRKAEIQTAEQVDRYIESIQEISLESAASIRSAFELYDALSGYGKSLVKNYALLLQYQDQYRALVATGSAQAAGVMDLIGSLGEISLESGDAILAARDAYDALDENAKALVTNLSTLEAAERAYAQLIAAEGASVQQVEELIAAIGEVTLDREDAILRARKGYDALDETAQKKVSNYDLLLKAEETLLQLKKQLTELADITAQLDALMAQIQSIAAESTQVSAENASEIAPLLHQLDQIILTQTQESQALLKDYVQFADRYRIAIGSCVHDDAATGVTAEGLDWYMQLRVETLSSSGDADYSKFKTLVSPKRILKLYRFTILNLITGEPLNGREGVAVQWTIPTPKYNDSAYSAVGVAHVGAAAAAQYIESSFADHNRKLKFSTTGDGLIGFVGTKAEMSAAGSVQGSGSVLNGAGSSGSGSASQVGSSGNSGGSSSTYTYSAAQSALLSQYGEAVRSGEWQYRETIILPALLTQFTDGQINLYKAISESVEKGANRFFAYAVTDEEFEAAIEAYRQSNPLSALADFSFIPEEGMVEVDYQLSEEAHLAAIESWRDQITRIMNYCLAQGDARQTASQLYRHLTTNLSLPPEDENASAPWQPEADCPNAAFYPSAYFALMEGFVSDRDAAQAYAYLLMQAGIECMILQESLPQSGDEILPDALHAWVALGVDGQWCHADAEIDIYNRRNPNAEQDALGHFGMDDAQRAASLGADRAWEMCIPDCMRPDPPLEGESAAQWNAVPECSGGFNSLVIEETVVITDGEEG